MKPLETIFAETKIIEYATTPGEWEKACQTVITFNQSGLEFDIPDSEDDAAFIVYSKTMLGRYREAVAWLLDGYSEPNVCPIAKIEAENKIQSILNGESE